MAVLLALTPPLEADTVHFTQPRRILRIHELIREATRTTQPPKLAHPAPHPDCAPPTARRTSGVGARKFRLARAPSRPLCSRRGCSRGRGRRLSRYLPSEYLRRLPALTAAPLPAAVELLRCSAARIRRAGSINTLATGEHPAHPPVLDTRVPACGPSRDRPPLRSRAPAGFGATGREGRFKYLHENNLKNMY
eukprot:scaffold439_cov415-Prasinococcus_capsulatus_cf.AAC.14